MAELTVGYRVPGEFIDLANALLPSIAPDLAPTLSVRPASHPPAMHHVGAAELEATLAAKALTLRERWATVALIDADPRRRARLIGELDSDVDVLAPVEAKGLEFDAVIVVEPSAMYDPHGGGWRPLFVAITRSVQHLEFVGHTAAPAEIAVSLGAPS